MQALLSSQLLAAPPVHLPSPHLSPSVQALPSSQPAVFGVASQPVSTAHESSVQGLPSSQVSFSPAHLPSAHWSLPVQASASSHAAVFGLLTQP